MLETGFFDQLVWHQDRMLYKEWIFRLQHNLSNSWELGSRCFVFYKTKGLVDQYAKFFLNNPLIEINNIFELGIWDGGSAAFWFER